MATRTGSRMRRSARALMRCGQGGGEQRGLPRLRGGLEDGLEVVREPEVEHLVRLVEDDGLHALQHEAPPPHEVERPSRRGHHDVDAAGEGLGLHAQRLPAVHGQHAHPEVAAVAVHGARDLDGQLAGGDEDDAAHAAAAASRRPGAGAWAAQRPRSCPCPSPPGPARRGRRAGAGSPHAGSGSAPRIRGTRARPPAGARGRDRRTSAPRAPFRASSCLIVI